MSVQAKAITVGILRALGVLLGAAVVVWVLFKLKSLLLFIGIAAVISLLGRPIVIFQKRRLKFKSTLAACCTLIIVIAFIAVLVWIFSPVVIEQSKNIAEIDFDLVKSDMNELSIQAAEYIGVEEIDLFEAIKQTDFVQNFDMEVVPSFLDIFFKSLGNLFVGIFVVLFLSFFLLRDQNFATTAVAALAKKEQQPKLFRIIHKTKELLSRYFLGLLMQLFILTLFYAVLLLFLGVNNAVAVAVICACLNIVPYLGPLLGGGLMLLIVFSNNLGADFSTELLPLMLYTFVGYCIAQLFDNIITQPVIFGKYVRSHPLEIFLVIIAGGLLFGIAGMIL
ncbi:MAG: AI-2E family transporter, partial [Marinirhabdus sp.]